MRSGSVGVCEENLRLRDVFEKSVDLYSVAARALSVARGSTPTDEYKRLLAYLEQARRHVEVTIRDWDVHRKEHGCTDRTPK